MNKIRINKIIFLVALILLLFVPFLTSARPEYAARATPTPEPEKEIEIGVHMTTWDVGLRAMAIILLILAVAYIIRL